MTSNVSVNLTLTAVPSAPRIPLVIPRTSTSSELRCQVTNVTNIPKESLRLIFRGRLIGDDDKNSVVDEYKIEEDSVIHCMGKPEEDEKAPSTSAATAAVSTGSEVALSQVSLASSGGTPPDSLGNSLELLRSRNSSSEYETAVSTLTKIVGNIAANPMEEKYRRVKVANAAFQRRLGSLSGGEACMRAVGFVLDESGTENYYVMHPNPEAWPKLMECKTKLETASREAKSAASSNIAAPPSVATLSASPPLGSQSGLSDAAFNMMSNPAQLQAMLQVSPTLAAHLLFLENLTNRFVKNPAVQQMMQNDPRFAGNPMLRSSVAELANNPQLLQMLSQSMADPSVRARLQNMGFPAENNAAPAPRSGFGPEGSARPSGQGVSTESDEAMTEEEMLQEAIQRSLRES